MELTINQLAAMKPQFLAWLETDWCTCKTDRLDDADPDDEYWTDADHHLSDGSPCRCYGRDEFDEVHQANVTAEAVVIHYGDRTLTLPTNDDDFPPADCDEGLPLFNRRLAGEPFITAGDLQWVGDDCDYYGPIVRWLAATFQKPIDDLLDSAN